MMITSSDSKMPPEDGSALDVLNKFCGKMILQLRASIMHS